jgi:hypothetical protein
MLKHDYGDRFLSPGEPLFHQVFGTAYKSHGIKALSPKRELALLVRWNPASTYPDRSSAVPKA